MKVQLKRKVGDDIVESEETVLSPGAELVCPEISKGRIVLERLRQGDGLLVLRIAGVRVRSKSVPSHFLLLSIVDSDDGVWVESDPVMTLPARKSNMLRDVRTVEEEKA
ncbi:hypothetical protein [Rhizobium sp. BK176]|uniref:hypothetical protein n=1 Tax=Rhizobium sp. BK176 TaxID=2587071 RepID=UPI0021695A08|nr:hypothetical protein [Rhizobium sp. BK176]MCS4090095.1 hypothetical protein [Rhizobium sp. BK176]